MDLTDKRFLITHTLVQNIMGSTVAVLEIADYLQHCGASVEVFAGSLGSPMSEEFSKRGIAVCVNEDKQYQLTDYDYIWINSQVFPLALVDQLRTVPQDKWPYFVFNHMSALDFAADEHPYLYLFEEKLSSLSVFVSEESRKALARYYEQKIEPTALFPNASSDAFSGCGRPSKSLARVAVISNHVPSEVIDAIGLLRQSGVQVDHIGVGGEVKLVSPEVLSDYDSVISIGKTVQYCLMAGVPIYLYDHFGGFGYLDSQVCELAASRNYSGRGGDRFTAERIAREIVEGYPAARTWACENWQRYSRQYSIAAVFPSVLGQAVKKNPEPFSNAFLNALKASQRFGFRFYSFWGEKDRYMWDNEKLRGSLREQAEDFDRERACMHLRVSELEDRLTETQETLRALRDSETYRIGKIIVFPFRLLKELVIHFMNRRADK